MADLHIHSTLSPCGNLQMSPKKIVEKAKEIGINLISITDHNAIANSLVSQKLANKNGIFYLFGMEVQTDEEIHVLTYFDNFKDLYEVWKIVYEKLPDVKNDPDYFGDQVIVDEDENIIGYEEKLLINSTKISFKELYDIVKKNNGIFIPAHIDRDSFSVISQLGFMPKDIDIEFVELSCNIDKSDFLSEYPDYARYNFISFSDAHFLEDIGRCYTIFIYEEKKGNLIKEIFNKENNISILRRFKC
ncbi:MAG: PHP domain-containing protein [Caldisericia bacterium]